MKKNIQEISKEGCIGVLAGSLSDLSKFNFSPWGIKCYHIESPALKKYVKKNSHKGSFENNWRVIYESSKTNAFEADSPFWDAKNLYVLVPNDLKKLPSKKEIFDCRLALLLLFPSEITVRTIHYFEIIDGPKIFCGGGAEGYDFAPFMKYDEPYEHYLIIPPKRINEINRFLKIFHERAGKINYIQTALKFYSMAWSVENPELSFVSLCIALEGIVYGKEQVTYRFRRNIAVLCGENEFYSIEIYKNVNRLYEFRSKIVHSSVTSKDYKYFEEYYKYGIAVASRMIIEMILHNIPNLQNLDEKLTELGFGDRKIISKNYKPFILNDKIYTDLTGIQLKSLKK